MEFKKERVYSAVNADELKPGDKVVVGNCISMIKAILVEGIQKNIKEINEILGEGYSERFHVGNNYYALAYLVERARNCTNCDMGEMDEDDWIGCSPDKIGKEDVAKTWCCDNWKPKTTEQKAEKKWCKNCGVEICSRAGVDANVRCPAWQPRAEPHYRPFRDTDELLKEWNKKLGYTDPTGSKLTEPYIWVKNKERGSAELIVAYNDNMFLTEYAQGDMEKLLEWYTFLDGSVCGVEE